ncbi:MAG: hypothetical protein CSA32_02190 [Desulfobulbus propionicus]|nr:MAG: hypothetical protein CSA32_02190 [Desulfobulbus propionicus]
MIMTTYQKPLPTLVNAILAAAREHGGAVALWSLPGQRGWRLIISLQDIDTVKVCSIDKRNGFILGPFTPPGTSCYGQFSFIEREIELVADNNNLALHWHGNTALSRRQAFESSLHRHIDSHSQTYHVNDRIFADSTPQHRHDFIEMVRTAISQIQKEIFAKVVLARNQFITLVSQIRCAEIFASLKALYPDTLVSLISTPRHGTWAGASPELLLEIDSRNRAHTMALAGTRQMDPHGTMPAWEEKEYHEHNVVDEYLQELIRKMHLGKYTIGERHSHRVGKLVHLRRDLYWQMENFTMKKALQTLKTLHPTPAVCGQPKDIAAQFIHKNEPFPRKHYAGFLGPVNFDSKITAFVNIRCMHLGQGAAELFAGAGITADSVPEHEWEEIEAKLEVMQAVLSDAHLLQQKIKTRSPHE